MGSHILNNMGKVVFYAHKGYIEDANTGLIVMTMNSDSMENTKDIFVKLYSNRYDLKYQKYPDKLMNECCC